MQLSRAFSIEMKNNSYAFLRRTVVANNASTASKKALRDTRTSSDRSWRVTGVAELPELVR